ncbi:MAG: TonB-dependent receptor [Chakrabartia sp.]
MRLTKIMLKSAIALTALTAGPAFAQEAPAEGTEEIIVTARRVNESLSDVPASITVLSGDTLEKTGAKTASDFVKLTPGVTIVTGSAEAGDTQINIRGLNGARDAESSVALVVDGILKTNTAALNQNQGTLRQIEILKGPQGALYGRNAAAGAIVVQTMKPGDSFKMGMEASYANENTIKANGYVSLPLGEGVGLLLSADYATTDGFFYNRYLESKTVDDQESWNVNGRLVVPIGDKTEVDTKLRYGRLKGASINFNASFHLPQFGAFNPAFYEKVDAHPFDYYSNIRPTNDQSTFEASMKLDHDFGSTALTAWVAYSDIKNDLTADGTSADFARYISVDLGQATRNDVNTAVSNKCFETTLALSEANFKVNQPGSINSSAIPFLFNPGTGSTFGPYSPSTCDGTQYQLRNQQDLSAEIRLASKNDGPINWLIGAYYLNLKREVGVSLGADLGEGVIQQLYNAPNTDNPTSQLFHDKFSTDVYAAFGSFDYKPNDKLDIGLAVRYDSEHRNVTNLVPFVLDPITGGPINPGQDGGPIGPQSKTFNQLQPKLTVRYELARDLNLYANYGVGFKSGGFNNQGSAAIVDGSFNNGAPGTINAGIKIDDLYRKEKSDAFELGVRGKAGPINFDLAGYYTKVSDMQFFEFYVGSFGLLRVVSNIDRVDLKGVEFNANANLMRGWSVFGSVNYTDSEIKKNASRPYTVGNASPYTAKYTINLGTQIDTPVTDKIDAVLRADYRITGPTWFHTVQDETVPTIFSGLIPISAVSFLGADFGNAKYDVARRGTFGVLDLRAGFEGERWKINVFANNALNKKYVNEVILAAEFGGSFISPGGRRLIGVQAGYKF